ncbi:MAG: FAD-dependent oxidoreductase [Planctomycetaceae bacterium]|nr:FAD-dependent oxidoreductase [Planctomycetaceae bacterium]
MSDPVVIIGGGLSGLVCARELAAKGLEVVLLEASDGVGGRVRTDSHEGFLLDRGFQVLLTAYPEARRQLHYGDLDLCPFAPGSLIQLADSRHRMSDPWRRPLHAVQTALAPVGGLDDKLKIAALRRASKRGSDAEVFTAPEQTTEQELRSLGFSETMIERFLRPFLGGVFLDSSLTTSSRMLYFVFRMFSLGDTSLPASGMGRISEQLAASLPTDTVRLRQKVAAVESSHVQMEDGTQLPYSKLVIATEQSAAARLLPELASERAPRSVYCVYYDAPRSPVRDRMLVLNGSGKGMVNNLCVPSLIAPAYAPRGRHLISATVLDTSLNEPTLAESVQQELHGWFGDQVREWKHLKTYRIDNALPNADAPAYNPPVQPAQVRDGVYVCGDYRVNGSINGAMQSGRLTAESLLNARPL